MSTASSESLALRKKLEAALYEFVKENDRLPTSTSLRRTVNNMFEPAQGERPIKYIQCRKFVKAKIAAGQFEKDKILAAEGKIVKAEDVPKAQEEQKEEEEQASTTGNLMKDAVIEATKEAIKEQQKKIEESTPSQQDAAGPVTVKDDAFDNIEVDDNAEAKKEDAAPQEPEVKYVTRKAIRSMSDEEQTRFFDAVDTMMKGKNGAGSSEFFRLAVKSLKYITHYKHTMYQRI